MEFTFTISETLLIYYALVNSQMLPGRWEMEREAEPKFMLDEETRKTWGIEYQETGFSVSGKKTATELWQALNAPTVKLDLERSDIEIALNAMNVCAFRRAERDYVLRLLDKLGTYQRSFQAMDALSRLPREVVMKAAEGKL